MRPMLAAATDGKNLKYPLLASPKFDGIRALVMNKVVVSRNLKPIPNDHVQRVFGKKKYNGLDGELIVGDPCAKDAFLKTTSGVMSVAGTPDVTFRVFDSYEHNGTFAQRLAAASALAKTDVNKSLVPVIHRKLKSEEELFEYEQEMLGLGFEGVMLRDPNGPYKFGRSTGNEGYLYKLKRFEDAEAVVLGCEELEHNLNTATNDLLGRVKRSTAKSGRMAGGVLGALLVRNVADNVEFSIGGGFTQQQRADLWEIRNKLAGKLVKYKYFPTGSKERPRFPVFLGFRDPIDA